VFREKWTKHSFLALPGSRKRPAGGGDVPPELGDLAAAVREALAPVSPAASFRQGLARDLAAMARQKRAPQVLLQRPPSYRRQIIIGAAVSSAVSVAGLIAVIWRHRSQHVAQRAA
jgi:hypothetical protein